MSVLKNMTMQVFKQIQYDKSSGLKTDSWTRTQYENCSFSDLNLKKIRITNCIFHNCSFHQCNFKEGVIGIPEWGKSGEFVNCQFINCDLTAVNFQAPTINQVTFKNCTLSETNFDGSVISNTKFIGELDSCFFRGYSKFGGGTFLTNLIGNKSKNGQNKMINVDFSEAKLVGVLFENKIDLSNCIFPLSEDYVYIKDLPTTIQKVRGEVLGWSNSEDRNICLRLIDNLYYSQNKKEQKTDFVDRFIPLEMENGDFNGPSIRLFNLIKQYS